MDNWLLYLLGAVGVVLLVALGLYLTGKKDLAKKIVLPLTLLVGLLVAAKEVLAGGSDAVRKENERIKNDLKKLRAERDALQQEIDTKTAQFQQQAAALQAKIDASDTRAAAIQQELDTMKAQGAATWFATLSDEEKRTILREADTPGVPGEFLRDT